MQNNIKLFDKIDDNDMHSMLSCIGSYSKSYDKGEFIVVAGDHIEHIGVMLSGAVTVIKEDAFGGRHIKATIKKNDLFAHSIVCAGLTESPVSIRAEVDCSVLFMSMKKTLLTCNNACSFHSQLVLNLVSILANKNLALDKKTDYLLAKTVKQKVAKYLCDCINLQKSLVVDVGYNRNDLAEFLGVERSVLSRELSKMKKEKIIDFEKKMFKILDHEHMNELAV